MKKNYISIVNAKENNLKSVSVNIPKEKFVVITGVSGSGKSSLAFNVLYNEGRRRYVDSLSNYVKEFLGGTSKPDVESIEGLSPTIAIDQKTTSSNPRSTVGTITEIYDFYRLLYGRIGVPYCPTHNEKITKQTIKQILDIIYKENKKDSMLRILSPVVEDKKGTHADLLNELREKSFVRVKIDDKIYKLSNEIKLEKNKKHSIFIIVDNILLIDKERERLYESITYATDYSKGIVIIENIEEKTSKLYSKNFACKHGDFDMVNIEPRLFSFNSPMGSCPKCNGIGSILQTSLNKLFDRELSILEGGIKYFNMNNKSGWEMQIFFELLKYYDIPINVPVKNLTKKQVDIIIGGSKEKIDISIKTSSGNAYTKYDYIEGVGSIIERRYVQTNSKMARKYYHNFLSHERCDKCLGARLNDHAMAVKVNKINIHELTNLSISKSIEFFNDLKKKMSSQEKEITKLILDEIDSRLVFLANVGLDYLSIGRTANTLSGGESQRIRLASQLGSKLTGVIYVLDEPSIGLHQSDNSKLIDSLKEMRDIGNTIVVVEHDEETMLESDYIIDIGPMAGDLGGEVVAVGTPSEMRRKNSITGKYLDRRLDIETPKETRIGNKKEIKLVGAAENNLKNVDLTIPLGKFISVTGVSGSGKSTLINEVLVKAILEKISRDYDEVSGKYKKISGFENVDKIVKISQKPIGRTPRSNPATYTSAFDDIRDVFASLPESKVKGFLKGRFSFNVDGGRCEKCRGDGLIKISMHFLPDVYIKCDECGGTRYNEETLSIKYKEKTISDILNMSINDALIFFENYPKLKNKIKYLVDVGLGYLKLGHSATLLSGGEAQRIKLATHLQKRATGKTIYVLDEPTTGLHMYDVNILLKVLHRIVDKGDTVIVIEHNLDLIKTTDLVVDLGPKGGINGGEIVAIGTPREISKNKNSLTGKYLKKFFNN